MLCVKVSVARDPRLRVALFHPGLYAGGIQRVFVELARSFTERGLSVDLVQATHRDEFRHALPQGIRVIELNARRALTSLFPLVRYLRRERPDVMICGAIQTNIVAVWARRICGLPVSLIVTEHNAVSTIASHARSLSARWTPALVRCFYPLADEIVAVSRDSAADLQRILGGKRAVHVIQNPIIGPAFWRRAQEPLLDPSLLAERRTIVLAVGRMHFHKDYPTLLHAFALLRRRRDACLVVLGDGEERAALEQLAVEMGLSPAIRFLGNVDNPLPYMKRTHVLALSSITEALPTVLIEAMAMNLPIVATDCPVGPREILQGGAYGRLISVGDPQAMADALHESLSCPKRFVLPPQALDPYRAEQVIDKYMALIRPGASDVVCETQREVQV